MMKYRLKIPFYLTWQYLRRGKKWTIFLTVGLLSVAFMFLLFVSSLFMGIIEGSNVTVRNTISGDIFITPKTGEDAIDNSEKVIAKIRDVAGVDGVSAQTIVPGSIEYNKIVGQGTIYAVTPSDDKEARTLTASTTPAFLADNDTDGIILGKQIAGGDGVENNAFSFKGAQVGDKVTLTLGQIKKEFTVRGILDTGFISTDMFSYITQNALSKLAPTFDDTATTIVVKTKSDADLDSTIEKIRNLNLDILVYPWQDASGIMTSISSSFVSINALMTVVGIMIAAIAVFIVIYVDILNKRRQIGIFKAIGINSTIIVSSYILLSAVYAFIGVLVGTVLFYGIAVPYFDANPIVLPITDARLVLTAPEYVWRGEVVFWVAVLSGFIPSVIVSRAKMLDSILGTR
jgi:putative ABC transport system permease protein